MKFPIKLKLVDKEGFIAFCEKNGEGELAAMVAEREIIVINRGIFGLFDTGIPGTMMHTTIGLHPEELQFFEEVKY